MRSATVAAAFILFFVPAALAATVAVPENAGPWGTSPDEPVDKRGIYVNLAETMASRTKIAVDVKFVPYGRMLAEVKSGEADYAFGVIGPATQEAGPFTTVVGKLPMIAVARRGLKLTTLSDLHGFSELGYLRGGSCGAAVDADLEIHRVAQDSYDTAIRKMAAGHLDGWCSVKVGFVYALNGLGMQDQVGQAIDYGEVRIGFQMTRAKVDSAEANELSAVLAGMVKDGVTGQIFTRYVGAPYQD